MLLPADTPQIAVRGVEEGSWHWVSRTLPPAGIAKLATEVATLEVPSPIKIVFAPALVTTRSPCIYTRTLCRENSPRRGGNGSGSLVSCSNCHTFSF